MSDKKDGPNRLGHAAVGVGQTLLVWGGLGVEETSLVERFDVVSTTWRDARRLQGDSLPNGLHDMVVTSDGEMGYVFSGHYSGSCSDKLFAINLTSLECRELVPSAQSSYIPGPRSASAMVYSEGRLVMYGDSREVEVFDLNKSETMLYSMLNFLSGVIPPCICVVWCSLVSSPRRPPSGNFC